MSNCFDVQHSNVERQTVLMFHIRMSKVKMIQMSNIKLFDILHSNDECQNDMNVVHQTVLMFDIQISKVKMI